MSVSLGFVYSSEDIGLSQRAVKSFDVNLKTIHELSVIILLAIIVDSLDDAIGQ